MRIPWLMKPRHVRRNRWTVQRVHALAYEKAGYLIIIGVAAFALIVLLIS
jgi:hypothetical protein